jgi:hypothetical protein
MIRDLQVYVRNANRQVIGETTRWSSVTVDALRNDMWRWTLVTSDPEDAALMLPPTNSAGVVTEKRGVIIRRIQPDGSAVTVMSGWMKYPDVDSSGGQTTWTFSGYDDTATMRVLLWPLPLQSITSQTETHDRRTGPISNRNQDYFLRNIVNRLAVPGTFVGSQLGIGASGVSQVRFDDALPFAQKLTGRAVNFQVRQRDSDQVLFLYQWAPPDKRAAVRFSPALGNVTGWSSTSTECTANIVIVGAGGEGVLRRFRRYADNASVTAWGPIEVFVDRRDLNPDEDEDWELQAEVAGLERLEEGAARSSFSLDISTGAGIGPTPFVDFFPGDRVLAYAGADENQIPIGPVTDDLVESVQVTYSEAGEEGSVRIGSVPDDVDNVMARQIRELGRRTHGLETRR